MHLLHPAVDKCTRRPVLDPAPVLLLSPFASHLNTRHALCAKQTVICAVP